MFDAAKCGTVLSLGVSRQALINAFSSAQTRHALLEAAPNNNINSNKNNNNNSSSSSSNETQDSGFLEVLERYTGLGIHLIHHTFTVAELFAMSGLQLTSKAVKTSLKAVEESVRVLDGIFGSSETSRAIAGIVTLMHREIMNDPNFELAKEGKIAILTGLTRAITTFAVLQSLTHQRTMKQFKMTVFPHNFPRNHIINNIAHFMRYASAAYGESFMRILGIGDIPSAFPASADHPNHHAFAHHTGVPIQDILLSSYTDASLLSSMHHPSMHALVHYVAVDHQAKAIVLTCRGTLGLSDILTDLTCGYVDFDLPTDQPGLPPVRYRAHGGMLDAAQRLAAREKGRVFQTIRQGLQRYPEYGLVLCGHSLGGGVVGLLSVIWSERREQAVSHPVPFVTSPFSGLPAGRPIHCYTYGPPCCMSLELSEYCGQGLVTSVVHGYDFVSGLSIGLLKDLKNVAQTLHTESNITDEIIGRLIGQQTNKIFQPTGPFRVPDEEYSEDDQWFWALIKTMRADMTGEKIYPPSTIYHIKTTPHSSHSRDNSPIGSQSIGSAAHTVVLSRCEDVKARFSEIIFTKSMFMDHSPNVYEKVIRQLCRGFFDQKGAYDQV
ncbi:Alpha/Beta hydrolase protein [Phycomyces blakesleeanus]|uniref:sn-1-specific diacylglycerol lipase n=1 Tax=Phycomyces blakesleeanus TaxID=4837 RepID=A0ABR3ASI2_PHYBL